MDKNFIPKRIYKKIISSLPIPCIDLAVKQNKSFLLVKRKEEPVKNQWWFPGGRVLFNESLNQAAKRKLKEEVNIKEIKKIKFLGVGELKFKKGIFNQPIHSITSVFLAEIDKKEKNSIKVNQTSTQYKWFGSVSEKFHPYVKKFLKLAGF